MTDTSVHVRLRLGTTKWSAANGVYRSTKNAGIPINSKICSKAYKDWLGQQPTSLRWAVQSDYTQAARRWSGLRPIWWVLEDGPNPDGATSLSRCFGDITYRHVKALPMSAG